MKQCARRLLDHSPLKAYIFDLLHQVVSLVRNVDHLCLRFDNSAASFRHYFVCYSGCGKF